MKQTGEKINTGFTLRVIRDGKEEEAVFSELLDRPAVVSVYMKNNTPGCDRQNRSLADHAKWFDDQGYNLIAISKDSCRSHQNYAKKLGISYILASDPDYKFADATDSIVEKKMFGKTFDAPSRSAFVIDKEGTLLGIVEKVDTKAHADELKELIRQLSQSRSV